MHLGRLFGFCGSPLYSRAMPVGPDGYDAFMSYSHKVDEPVVRALQLGLERFSRPWYKPRILRVFRDRTNLSASPQLWSTIERALANSKWLIVMSSQESAQSPWVEREIGWWLAHRDIRRILLVLTNGQLVWNGRTSRWDEMSNAVPPILRAWMRQEPFWQDLRRLRKIGSVDKDDPALQDCVARIAAALQGRPLDELVGEHVRQRRLTRTVIQSVIAVLSVLLVVSLVSAVIAVQQRNEANEQAKLATARALAATSESVAGREFDLSLLLAVAAYQLSPDSTSQASLFRAAAANPQLVRYFQAGSDITSMTASADGEFAVVGTKDGRVVRWHLADGQRTDVMALANQVTAVATSNDGQTVAAIDGAVAKLWGRDGTHDLRVPAGEAPNYVAVSPSGQAVVLCSSPASTFDGGTLTRYGVGAKPVTVTGTGCGSGSVLTVSGADEFVVWSVAGDWEKRSLSNLTMTSAGQINTGVHYQAVRLSDDGRYFTYSNGARNVPAWRTDSTNPDPNRRADAAVAIPGSRREAVAISRDGRIAVADAGTIYVTSLDGRSEVIELAGSDRIGKRGVQFLDNSHRLLSFSGNGLALWDLDQYGRIGARRATTIPQGCSACGGPLLAARHDGAAIAAVADSPLELSITALDEPSAAPIVVDGGYQNAPLWSPDGSRLLVPSNDGIEIRDATQPDAPVVDRIAGDALAMGFRSGTELMTLDQDGNVTIRDLTTETVLVSTKLPTLQTRSGRQQEAIVGSSGVIAVNYWEEGGRRSKIVLLDSRSGDVKDFDDPDGVAGMGLGGSTLLLQRYDGSLTAIDVGSQRQLWALPVQNLSSATNPTVSPDGRLAAVIRPDGVVLLLDATTGARIGEIHSAATGKAGLVFSGDSRRLLVGVDAVEPGKAEIQQWLVAPDDLVAQACRVADRELTDNERERFFAGLSTPTGRCRP